MESATEYYERPMVRRIREVFGNPTPPSKVTQKQFDWQQEELEALAQKPWHAIQDRDYSIFLMDVCYVHLQQELFDYLFPAVLIRWREGLLDRTGGPPGECDLYRAIDHGEPFYKVMDATRRQHIHQWMVDAYTEAVDAWSNNLSTEYKGPASPDDLHGLIYEFNALGHSVPIVADILERLMEVTTLGRAQWWLVFASGLAWKENECPAIGPWSPERGGGGVYLSEDSSLIYDHGFLRQNLDAMSEAITYANVLAMLRYSCELLTATKHSFWASETLAALESSPSTAKARIEQLLRDVAGSKLDRSWD